MTLRRFLNIKIKVVFLLTSWRLQAGVQAPLEAFKTATKGWGVRATATIQEGTYICSYAGEVRLVMVRVGDRDAVPISVGLHR